MANQYGLIGYPLEHSFSKKYFDEKFKKMGTTETYTLFEIQNIEALKLLISNAELKGLNVTIPYKKSIIPYLDRLNKSAKLVGAVNVVKIEKGYLTGFNTDYPAFKTSLKKWLDNTNLKALVLGTGGASKAVIAALNDLKITYQQVSRVASKNAISYETLADSKNSIKEHRLIINTTPLGMFPHVNSKPDIAYNFLTSSHYVYDLVYNPAETQFLKQGRLVGCITKNGLEMLHLQAELAWDIWNA